MAPNPISCSHRLVFPITVDGQTHFHKLFVHAIDTGGGVYNLVHAGNPNQPWGDDANHWQGLFAGMYESDAVFGDIRLEAYSLGTYILRDTIAAASPGTSVAGSYFPASQLTFVCNDSAVRKMRLVLCETGLGNPFHFNSSTTSNADVNAMIDDIFSPVAANDAGFWLRSRTEHVPGSFLGVTATDNRKLRRNRGLV